MTKKKSAKNLIKILIIVVVTILSIIYILHDDPVRTFSLIGEVSFFPFLLAQKRFRVLQKAFQRLFLNIGSILPLHKHLFIQILGELRFLPIEAQNHHLFLSSILHNLLQDKK